MIKNQQTAAKIKGSQSRLTHYGSFWRQSSSQQSLTGATPSLPRQSLRWY